MGTNKEIIGKLENLKARVNKLEVESAFIKRKNEDMSYVSVGDKVFIKRDNKVVKAVITKVKWDDEFHFARYYYKWNMGFSKDCTIKNNIIKFS